MKIELIPKKVRVVYEKDGEAMVQWIKGCIVVVDGVPQAKPLRTLEARAEVRRLQEGKESCLVLRSEYDLLVEALRSANGMCENALPKFNWGASFLDSDAFQSLNETPGKIARALARSETV